MSIINDKELEQLMIEHEKTSGKLKSAMGGDNCWDAGLEIVKECGDYDGGRYSIVFSSLSDEKIKILMRRFTNLEWLGYLVGQVDHVKRNVYVEDFIIPKQRVSSGMVDNVEYGWNEGLAIIGVIHSHHGMGAFFSGTDDAYINQNHDVSIVVATRPGREIKAQVRVKMKCGKYFINEEIGFYVNAPVVLDVADFMTIINNNIQTPAQTNKVKPTGYRPFVPNKVNFGTFEDRIGFLPFDALDEGEFDLDDEDDFEDDEEDEFQTAVMMDILKRDVSTLGTPVNQPEINWDTDKPKNEGLDIFKPWQTDVSKTMELFKENIKRQKLGWLYSSK